MKKKQKERKSKIDQDRMTPYFVLSKTLDFHAERGAVLMCGAVVDQALERLIKAKFQTLSDTQEEEIDFLLTRQPVPPLGSFGIRIRMAKVLGVITEPICKTLQGLLAIRNDFAHNQITPQLNDALVRPVWNGLPVTIRDFVLQQKHVADPVSPDRLLMLLAETLVSILHGEEQCLSSRHPPTS